MWKNLAMHRVVVLALDGVYPFEMSIPVRIFGTVTGEDDKPLYEVITCSLDGGPVTTSADFALVVEHGAEVLETADTLVIPPFTPRRRAVSPSCRTSPQRGCPASANSSSAATTSPAPP